jgi:hypothetical protein
MLEILSYDGIGQVSDFLCEAIAPFCELIIDH